MWYALAVLKYAAWQLGSLEPSRESRTSLAEARLGDITVRRWLLVRCDRETVFVAASHLFLTEGRSKPRRMDVMPWPMSRYRPAWAPSLRAPGGGGGGGRGCQRPAECCTYSHVCGRRLKREMGKCENTHLALFSSSPSIIDCLLCRSSSA